MATITETTPVPQSALSNLISSSTSSSSSSSAIGGAKSEAPSDALSLEVLHNLQYQHNWVDLKLHTISLNVTNGNTVNDNGTEISTRTDATPPGGLGIVDIPLLSSAPGSSGLSGSSTRVNNTTSDSSKPGNTTRTVTLISGLPPRHSYVHPDLQNYLVKHKIEESSLPVQREFVLPLSLNETWTLSRFCGVFDQLPDRQYISVPHPPSSSRSSNSANATRQSRNTSTNMNGTLPDRSRLYEHRDQKRVLLGMRAKTGVGGDGTIVYYIMQEGEVKPRQNG